MIKRYLLSLKSKNLLSSSSSNFTIRHLLLTPIPFRFTTERNFSIMSPDRNHNLWDFKNVKYPKARREDFLETFQSKKFGQVKVSDPYCWLEKPSNQSEETKEWVKSQADLTESYLSKIPEREIIKELLTKTWNYPRFSIPSPKRNGFHYYTHNTGLQAQSIWYRIKDEQVESLREGEETKGDVFFNPNLLSEDGTISVNNAAFSKYAKYWAYALSKSGSDWSTIYVRKGDSSPHVSNSPDDKLSEELKHVRYSSISWTVDEKGFFYQRMIPTVETPDAGTETEGNKDFELMYHRIGESQDQDTLVYKDPQNPYWMFWASQSLDGKWLYLYQTKDTSPSNKLWVLPWSEDLKLGLDLPWIKIADDYEGERTVLHNEGSLLYIQTNLNADKGKIVVFDIDAPEKGFIDHIPHTSNPLSWASVVNEYKTLLLCYQVDVKDRLDIHDLKTGEFIRHLNLGDKPVAINSTAALGERKDMWIRVQGFTNPGVTYRYDFEKDEIRFFSQTRVEGFSEEEFISEQVFYPSKDGTKIPMFLTYPKGFKKDLSSGVLLYAYGGFSHTLTPWFSPSFMTLVKYFGITLAIAGLRGGGEYGEAWHEAGIKEKKQNVFDDFQYAAKWLAENKFSKSENITISGASNGGLLIGACVNQAPELFGCALADVGVMDMLRFHRYSIGKAWTADYGCSDVPEEFDYLYAYSPLHNVDASKIYPPTMLLTADHDDRVVPLHSFKLMATMQHELKDNPNPLLLRVEIDAGHGSGKSMEKIIQEYVRLLLLNNYGQGVDVLSLPV